MQTIDEIRRTNLELAIQRLGGKAVALANAAGMSAAYISQIRTRQPDSKSGKPKALGDDAARKVEAALGEPAGWMDVEHGAATAEPLTVHDPAAGTGEFLKQADEFIARASVLREMQIAQAAAILAALPDSALSKALGFLQDLQVSAAAPAGRVAGSEDQPVFSRNKVITFTGLVPEPTAEKQHKK